MRAAVLDGPGRLAIAERPVPKVVAPGGVLVEVEACGICGTDLHIVADPPGHPSTPGVVLGHELAGIIRETGSDPGGLSVGGRVVVAPNLACGSCVWCRRGLPNHCERFTTVGIFRDGGLARFVAVPASACHPISSELPAPVAALAEPLSCVVNGIEHARVAPGETAVVLGAGPIGLMFAALFRAQSAGKVIVVQPPGLRREMASRMGAHDAVTPDEAEEAVRAVDDSGADVVVDAVGNQLATALRLVTKGGRILLFGMDATARTEIPQLEITRGELTVFGTYVGVGTFPRAIRILERGIVDLQPMLTHVVGLDELADAMAALRAGTAVKVSVDPRR